METATDEGQGQLVSTPTIDQTLAMVVESRAAVEAVIAGRTAEELTRPGADGWSAKDHLAHLAAWQRSLEALLAGASRAAAIGMGQDAYQRSDTDGLNEHIFAAHHDEPLEAVLTELRAAYQAVVVHLERMTTDDLYRPYRHYQPHESDPTDPRNDTPVLEWIAGNTWDHEPEHLEMIRAVLAADL
jgi:hypothetical protein